MAKTAFEAPRGNIYQLDPSAIVIIGLDTQHGPEHPLYDARIHEPLREATVLDIMKRGVIEPIAVRKDGVAAVVIDGRRRVMHAREANRRLEADGKPLVKVPALSPHKGTDADHAELLVVLNEHREGDSMVNRARKAQAMLSRGFTEAQVAQMFAVSVSTLKNFLSLLDLSEMALKALADKTIGLTEAYGLAKKSRDEQDEILSRPETAPKAPRKRGPNRAELVKQLEAVRAKPASDFNEGIIRALEFVLGDAPTL
jgi:ParB family chromosome partitioning protein